MDLAAARFLLKGEVIGLCIAAPVGPIGVLCIQRSLLQGWCAGFVAGLGAATADAAYSCVAAFSLAVVSAFLVDQRRWIGLLGGLFPCYLGLRTILSRSPAPTMEPRPGALIKVYVSTFFLTLANPATILSFIAVFAGFGLGTSPNILSAGALVVGVFFGSALWWQILSTAVSLLRARLTTGWMRGINALSGLILLGFGLYSLSIFARAWMTS